MNLTRLGSFPFGWKVVAVCLPIVGLSALKYVLSREIFVVVMAFVLLTLLCAHALTRK